MLWLRLDPLARGEWSVTTRAKIRVAVASPGVHPKKWELRETSGDFRATNDLFNELQRVRIDGRTLPEWCLFDGVALWQFLPSYIAPSLFRAVEFASVVAPLVAAIRPSVICAVDASDGRFAEWRGVIEASAEQLSARVEWIPPSIGPRLRNLGRRIGFGRLFTDLASRTIRRLMAFEAAKQKNSADRSGRTLLAVMRGRDWVPDAVRPGRFRDEQFGP